MTDAPPIENLPSREMPRSRFKPNREWRFPVLVGLLAMALTLVPYLLGWSFANGRHFMWLGYNLDDSCVYLSWMRQAADGATRAYNLFSTDPQNGMALNPLFLVLGRFASLTGLPLLAVYHLARLVFGFGLLLIVWQFLRGTVTNERARKLAYLFVCFSAGIGWLPIDWTGILPKLSCPPGPVDGWQPEAITFLSLLLSPLFCFSMLLQVGTILLLYVGEQRGQMRYAVFAGLCGLLLALVHTYDVLMLAAVWLLFLVVQTARAFPSRRNINSDNERVTSPSALSSWLRGIVAGLITAPGVLYIAYQLKQETLFRQRANVPTLTPSLVWILLGYGLTFALALVALARSRPPKVSLATERDVEERASNLSATNLSPYILKPTPYTLLAAWLVGNIAVAYLPVPFQRKMLQGTHFPVAILAGVSAAWLLDRAKKPLTLRSWSFAAFLLTAFLSLTNLRFIMREIDNAARNRVQTGLQRAYLQEGELDALHWLRANTDADAAVQPLPWVASSATGHRGPYDITLACFAPGLTHRHVYCGHWGETPDFSPAVRDGQRIEGKFLETARFGQAQTTDDERIAMLRKWKVRYLVFSQKSLSDTDAETIFPIFRGHLPLPPYLTLVHTNPDADVYAVSPSVFTGSPANTQP